MLTTKRYDYVPIDNIHEHPQVRNHRKLDVAKVSHYERDILKNGLLEPLVVWERNPGEFFLVGGFHRTAAMKSIREKNPGYFDRVDVRVVAGEIDEMAALNLKLNADRVDAKIHDYFDTIIYLNNANWEKERIADFLDRSVSWVDDIIRIVPSMPRAVRKLMENDKLTWNKAKQICRAVMKAEPGQENIVLDRELKVVEQSLGEKPKRPPKLLTVKSAKKRLTTSLKKKETRTYTVDSEDLLALFTVLEGRAELNGEVDRVKEKFPGLID